VLLLSGWPAGRSGRRVLTKLKNANIVL
jgi:hypothetical protein